MNEQGIGPMNRRHEEKRAGQYFLCATPELNFGKNVVVGLSNPVDSGVNVWLDVVSICNLSKEMCRVEVCNAYHTLENLNKVDCISKGNLNNSCCNGAKGGIFFGINEKITKEPNWSISTVKGYETMNINEDDTIVVAPGTSHYYVVTALIGLKKPTINMNFKWREEKIED